MYKSQTEKDDDGLGVVFCFIPSNHHVENHRIQTIFIDVVIFIIPTGLMTFSYISIGKSLYKSIKENIQLSEVGHGERYGNTLTLSRTCRTCTFSA